LPTGILLRVIKVNWHSGLRGWEGLGVLIKMKLVVPGIPEEPDSGPCPGYRPNCRPLGRVGELCSNGSCGWRYGDAILGHLGHAHAPAATGLTIGCDLVHVGRKNDAAAKICSRAVDGGAPMRTLNLDVGGHPRMADCSFCICEQDFGLM